ncbi:MAG: hypothetical protein ACRC33_29285 [Gemmataceae bacterium]
MPPLPPPYDPMHDLADHLRAAVEAVRRDPAPVASLRRAADRARGLHRPRMPLRLPRLLLLGGALAASFLFGVALRHAAPPLGGFLAGDGTRGGEPAETRPRMMTGLGADQVPISVSRLSSKWADWEGVRMPGGAFVARRAENPPRSAVLCGDGERWKVCPAEVTVEVRVTGESARTFVALTFHPAKGEGEGVFEYPLPEGARVRSIAVTSGRPGSLERVDPEANVLRGSLGVLAAGHRAGLRVTYDQPLTGKLGRMVYSYPLPTCVLDQFSFTLAADKDEGAVFLPHEAQREERGGQTVFHVRHSRVKPSGSISYLTSRSP